MVSFLIYCESDGREEDIGMKEKIKAGLGMIGKAIKAGAKKIAAAVAAADTKTLVKFGIVFGTAIVTAAFIIKFLKDKKKSYHSSKNKTVVDEAINVNYNDPEKQDKLHPLMKSVKKVLKKDLKPRTKKASKNKKQEKSKKVFDKAAQEAYIKKVNKQFDQFLEDMAFEDEYRDEIEQLWGQDDDESLRSLWDEP